jgi:pimeloyl-ACP methyl ester carboxylesterase
MERSRIARLALAFILALGPIGSPPATAADTPAALREGIHEGADFQISMPTNWNGALVLFAHGYQGEGRAPGNVQGSPLNSHLTHNGYAWAASGFRSLGYRPDWFLADTLALRRRFIGEFGPPRWTMIHGQSMGGHVAVAALELHPEIFQASLIECGVVDGVGLIDWLYAYTAAAEYISGAPLLDTPRPAFGALVNGSWLPLMGSPGSYTERGRRFDSVVKHLSGGDLALRLEGLARRYVANLNPREPGSDRAQEFARHADTRHIRYDVDPGLGIDAATLNREVRRAVPAPDARSRGANPLFAELTGRIAAPLMTIHETADFRVPFRLQQDYRRRAEAAGSGHLLVQRVVTGAGHCGLDGRVRERGFDDLVGWLERGTVPSGDDVLGDVSRLGGRWTP